MARGRTTPAKAKRVNPMDTYCFLVENDGEKSVVYSTMQEAQDYMARLGLTIVDDEDNDEGYLVYEQKWTITRVRFISWEWRRG